MPGKKDHFEESAEMETREFGRVLLVASGQRHELVGVTRIFVGLLACMRQLVRRETGTKGW